MRNLLLLFLFNIAFADAPKLYLLHINGLDTTRQKAISNEVKYITVARVSPNVLWDVVYNPTQSGSEWDWVAKIKGFIDVCWQKWFGHEELPSLDDITQEKMIAESVNYPIGSDDYKAFQSTLVSDYQDLLLKDGGNNMESIIDEFHNTVPPQYASVINLLESANYSNTKDYVILLPHSQGNIYANNLYNYITQTEDFDSSRISIFGYASPAKVELGQMMCNASVLNYATSTNDGVIALSRLFFGESNVLPSNVTIPPLASDQKGHGVTEVYLSNPATINMLNEFINVTSNSCFKDLHTTTFMGALPSITGRIVYDKLLKQVLQVNNSNQICSINVESGNTWNCITVLPGIINSIDMSLLTTDGNGTEYLIGNNGESKYLITDHNGEFTYQYVESYQNLGGKLLYANDDLFQYDGYNGLARISLDSYTTNWMKQFTGLDIPTGTPYGIDGNGSIFVAPRVPSYTSTVQVYYQSIGDDSTTKSFASPTSDYLLNDMLIYNNMIYLCAGIRTYYLPLDVQKDTAWNIMGNGCSQITGDEQYLFTTFAGNLSKYTM